MRARGSRLRSPPVGHAMLLLLVMSHLVVQFTVSESSVMEPESSAITTISAAAACSLCQSSWCWLHRSPVPYQLSRSCAMSLVRGNKDVRRKFARLAYTIALRSTGTAYSGKFWWDSVRNAMHMSDDQLTPELVQGAISNFSLVL